MKCNHENLQASAEGAAVFDNPQQQGEPVYYCLDIKARCARCGMPFQFIGEFGPPKTKLPGGPFIDTTPGEFVTKLSLPMQPAPVAKRWGPKPRTH